MYKGSSLCCFSNSATLRIVHTCTYVHTMLSALTTHTRTHTHTKTHTLTHSTRTLTRTRTRTCTRTHTTHTHTHTHLIPISCATVVWWHVRSSTLDGSPREHTSQSYVRTYDSAKQCNAIYLRQSVETLFKAVAVS